MPTINQLSSTTSLTTADKMVVYSQDNGDARKATLSTLLNFLHENYQEEGLTTQVVTPTSGQNIILPSQTTNIWLVLTPASTIASLTVTLPTFTSCFDGQTITVATTSYGVTTLNINGNGAYAYSSPMRLPPGGLVTLKFNVQQQGWYGTDTGINPSYGNLVVTDSIDDINNHELISFVSTPSAVNEVKITNAAAGGDPLISVDGSDANTDLNLLGKGTGTVKVNGDTVITALATQTLSSKTLASPTLTGPTDLAGSVIPDTDNAYALGNSTHKLATASIVQATLTQVRRTSGSTTSDIGTSTDRFRKIWTEEVDTSGAAVIGGELGLAPSAVTGVPQASITEAGKISLQDTVLAWATITKETNQAFSDSSVLRFHNFNSATVVTVSGNKALKLVFSHPMDNTDYAVMATTHFVAGSGMNGMRYVEIEKHTTYFYVYVWRCLSVSVLNSDDDVVSVSSWILLDPTATSGDAAVGFSLDVAIVGDQA